MLEMLPEIFSPTVKLIVTIVVRTVLHGRINRFVRNPITNPSSTTLR